MSTVRETLNRGGQQDLGALTQLSRLGDGLALISRTHSGPVTGDVLELPTPAVALLAVFATAGTSAGRKAVVATETTPSAGNAAINTLGNVAFAAADVVTSAVVVYVGHEGQIFVEQVDVSAAGVATLRQNRSAVQLLAGLLDAGSAAGPKSVVARANGAPAAGEVRLANDGSTVNFNGTDVGASPVTGTVMYIALPGVTGTRPSFGDRLDANYPFGLSES